MVSARTPSGSAIHTVPAKRPSFMFHACLASFDDQSVSGVTKSMAPASPAPFLRKSGMCRRPRTSRMSPPARLRGFASAEGSPDQRCRPPRTTMARRRRAPARSPSPAAPSTRRQRDQMNQARMPIPSASGSAPIAHDCRVLSGTPRLSVAPLSACISTTPIMMQAHGPPIRMAAPATVASAPREPDGSTTSGVAPPTRQCAPAGTSSAHSGQRSSAVNAPYGCAGAPGRPVSAYAQRGQRQADPGEIGAVFMRHLFPFVT